MNLFYLAFMWGKSQAVSGTSRLPICASGNFRLASAFLRTAMCPCCFAKLLPKQEPNALRGFVLLFMMKSFPVLIKLLLAQHPH